MELDKMGSVLIGSLGVLVALVALSSVARASTPPQPVLEYVCPIDGLRFATYEELSRHFAEVHPATPIDIIWE